MASNFSTPASVLAVDLTCAGASASLQRDRDPETETFIMARLAGLAQLLDRAGADLITTGAEFRLGGKRRRDDYLDGALALSRLGQHTGAIRFAASIPLGPATANNITSALASVLRSTSGRGGWQVEAPIPEPVRAVDTVLSGIAEQSPTVVVNVRTDVDVEVAAARADVVRLRVSTVEEGRHLRSAIRAAAKDWGRSAEDLRVLVDLHAVLGDDVNAARNRAQFIRELDPPHAQGLFSHAGSVATLANVWQNWVRAGAADGFTLIPGSIPTDVLQIATGLLPELARRGLRAPVEKSAPAGRNLRTRRRPVAA